MVLVIDRSVAKKFNVERCIKKGNQEFKFYSELRMT